MTPEMEAEIVVAALLGQNLIWHAFGSDACGDLVDVLHDQNFYYRAAGRKQVCRSCLKLVGPYDWSMAYRSEEQANIEIMQSLQHRSLRRYKK